MNWAFWWPAPGLASAMYTQAEQKQPETADSLVVPDRQTKVSQLQTASESDLH